MQQRVGLGFDVHRLEVGRPCMLGGLELPFEAGCRGHSDGDAVLHAIADALLGGAGLDDLGTLFRELDPEATQRLIQEGVISGGMIPKINCCLDVLLSEVRAAHIIDGRQPHSILQEILTDEGVGTMFHT